jgi:tetratricopeptide (TPR) repeat protein
MKNLIQLIVNLRADEVRLTRVILKAQSVNKISNRLKLFNLILDKKVKTNNEAAAIIYNKKANQVFYNLKSRLKKDILNTLLFQDTSNMFSTDYVKAITNCRVGLLQGSLLISRGVYGEGISVLKNVKKLAIKFDLPGELTIIEERLRNFYVMREGISALDKYEFLMHTSNELYSKHIDASNYMYRLSIPALFQASYKGSIRKAREHLLELERLWDTTGRTSERIGFYYHVGAINYYMVSNQYNKAKGMCQSFFELIEGSVSLNTISNKGGAHLEMTSVYFRLEEFDEALIYAKKTRVIFRKNSFNKLLSQEYCFLGYYYNHQHKKAITVFNEAQNIPQINSSVMRREKWNYMLAFNEYKLGNNDNAIKYLNNCSNLIKDSSGLYLGIRLLNLIISTDKKEVFPTDLKLNNLMRVFRQLEKENISRFRSIYKVVRFLTNNQFNFKLTLEKQANHLDLLKEGEGDYLWNPLGYEMIRFDEWFMSKVDSNKL